MIVTHTSIPFDPARREEAMALVSAVVEATREESGVVRYSAAEDSETPGLVRFFEQYEDAAAARTHTETAHYRRFVEALPDLVDGDIETVQATVEDVEAATFTAAEAAASIE
ncbi:putative quinol monooxygenase [Halobaculum litoreum]|uniref:Quinol monooxygenase n=1 Tax=Halobaculum litoreum TaxID=3031998 RepID=A0ABD5XSC7_9EURY|nr:putative quinol monooxygenase [Halobaculum sp. DT92]